ncbi:MAG: hypothetical protein JO249_21045 [Acidobacteria bacterium]|nr:hypothetical protein [Acidobacteriota bacterium]
MAEIVLFTSGIGRLAFLTHSIAAALQLGLLPFLSAEVLKVMFASAIRVRLWPPRQVRS